MGRIGALSALFLVIAEPSLAQDESAESEKQVKLQCAQSYERAQRLRKEGQWSEAQEQAVACAQDSCPAVLSTDCANWVDELVSEMPSHVFLLEDDTGAAVTGGEVSVDGGPFVAISGQPISFDPGSHEATFRAPSGEELALSFQSTAGQKNVLVRGKLMPEPGKSEEPPSGSSIPTATWVLGGVGMVSLGVFGALAISGSTQESRLEDQCSSEEPCNRDEGDALKATYLGADIALGVGLVSIGTGIAWWALSPKQNESSVSVGLGGPRGSTGLTLRSSF